MGDASQAIEMPQRQYARLSPSGISVIIVAPASVASAPPSNVIEKAIIFASNSGRIFERWEGVVEDLDPIIHKSEGLNFHTWDGEFLTRQVWDSEKTYGRKINGHRAEIHEKVYLHAKARGIDIRFGQTVTDYFETDDEAGVVCNGERLTADCVVSAEGVKSKGRKIVLGFEDRPKPSGYAVYRAWMKTDELAKKSSTKWFCHGDTHNGWMGEDKHFLVASIKGGSELSWVLTHKDDGDIDEDWTFPGKKEDVIKNIASWDPALHDLVNATPPDKLHDYKLVFRDPLPTFISPKARIALIGDAAHPFLPTSIQGASQSMEDGVALAITLERSGKGKVQQAIRAYETIRYERVHRAQMTGVSTREQWHKADWEKIRSNPKSLHLKRESWLLDFDQEAHTYAVFDETVAKLNAEEAARQADSSAPAPAVEAPAISAAPAIAQTELVGMGQA
ncbi:6-hydroxynicotinate 3-monooxygenase [Cyphellophora attinorum]|uniref:6-hydroxynicotinate 3-monooxygenase n=1 Tax=Cyphellophora attinorum TaxID=1664694 RepID=A0A0N1HVU2_9EURO|nr:6-hydroxynicotinate 3-monooxygenase [Phialophora attinorum]KPI41516.1 6-hydroxynicotinate 3-monooxygenase [Phialophora attinorum]